MAIVESNFLYALVLSLHVAAMAVLLGCIAIVDCGLMGLFGKSISAEKAAAAASPLLWAAFALATITGAMLFPPQALRYAANPMFLAKMILLLLAGMNMAVFHWVTRRGFGKAPNGVRLAGAISLGLWISIAASGRLIAYFA